jgi:ferredoxin-NADP reductase
MRAKHGTFPVLVENIEQVTPLIRVFRLVDLNGEELPGFSGGSHIVVLIDAHGSVLRNPYSLISSPFDTRAYEIAVGYEAGGRGGSRTLHDGVTVGDTLEITYPANQFPLDRLAKKHVLLAGGVGVTPFLAHLRELELGSVPYEMHYGVRGAEHAGMAARISKTAARFTRIYREDTDGRIDFVLALASQPLGTHVYVCGPRAMLEAALSAARSCGWPDSHIHFELFEQQATGAPFSAYFALSGKTVSVPPELSLLEAAEAEGIAIPYLCRGGACGYCETDVLALDGEIIHRDIWLNDEQKRKCEKLMPCVSRAKCSRLVLNA